MLVVPSILKRYTFIKDSFFYLLGSGVIAIDINYDFIPPGQMNEVKNDVKNYVDILS